MQKLEHDIMQVPCLDSGLRIRNGKLALPCLQVIQEVGIGITGWQKITCPARIMEQFMADRDGFEFVARKRD